MRIICGRVWLEVSENPQKCPKLFFLSVPGKCCVEEWRGGKKNKKALGERNVITLCSWLSVHWKILSESHPMSLPDHSSKVENGKCHTFSLNDHTLSGLAEPQRSRGHFCSNQRFLISLHLNYFFSLMVCILIRSVCILTLLPHANFLFI